MRYQHFAEATAFLLHYPSDFMLALLQTTSFCIVAIDSERMKYAYS